MKNKRRNIKTIFVAMLFIASSLFIIPGSVSAADSDQDGYDKDTSQWANDEDVEPTGEEYILFEEWGGTWYDAEKTADDGDDNLMCWAASCANVLAWTGWGYVVHPTEGALTDEDEMFEHFNDHWTDVGYRSSWGWNWWFDGTETPDSCSVDVPGGGNFWPGYSFATYSSTFDDPDALVMLFIDVYLRMGWGVALSITWDSGGGHAITCWGINYDPGLTPADEDYYIGIWITDSDDDKHFNTGDPPPDRLRYYELEYNSGSGRWYLQDYYGDNTAYIRRVYALGPFTNTPPTADAGGPYPGFEGSPVTFDASGSSDPDGNPLRYRWDFDNDGGWDTDWLEDATTTHTYIDDYYGQVKLEVNDYMGSDTDMASMNVINVDPVITATGDTIDEDGTATVSGTITDPGSGDSFTVEIDWGEGSPETFDIGVGSTSYSSTHQYLDDNPTLTSSDIYTIDVEVTDDDGGSDTASTTVTVNNVNPEITLVEMVQPNEQFILPVVHTLEFTGDFTDVGILDTHTIEWDFGDSSPVVTGTLTPSHVYMAPGTYTVTLTITDDDTGVDIQTLAEDIEVVDQFGALEDIDEYIQDLDGSYFKGNPVQRKNALHNMLSGVYDMLVDLEYNGAINDLQNNIKAKADGYLGGNPNNDWIIDQDAQEHLCMKIDDLSAYLEWLLGL